MNTDLRGPIHLQALAVSIPEELTSKVDQIGFHPTIAWLRMIQTPEGNSLFQVKYYGDRPDDEFITPTSFAQEKVVAVDVKSGKEYLLFDAYQHGAGALLVNDYSEEVKKVRPVDKLFVARNGSTIFQLFALAYYNSTREHIEEELDEDGDFVMPNGEEIDPETAIANAFDCFFIYGLDEKEELSEIVFAEELENR
jgi:hypothetical protein